MTNRAAKTVTFRQFAELAHKRSLSAQSLAKRFRGRIENPLEFFARVLSGKAPDSIIPYRSILEFYEIASSTIDPALGRPACACGCGAPVFDRKKWATPGCRTKARRAAIRNEQMWLGQLIDFVKPRLRQNRRMGTLPLTEGENANLGKLVKRKTEHGSADRAAAVNE